MWVETLRPRSVMPVPFVVNVVVLEKLFVFLLRLDKTRHFSYKAFQTNLRILDMFANQRYLFREAFSNSMNVTLTSHTVYLFRGDDHENQTFAALSFTWMVSMGVEVDVG